MRDIIKKYLFIAIAFISGILVTLGSVIFQNYSFNEQISIFKFFLFVLIILIVISVLFLIYTKFSMIKWKVQNRYKVMIGIEGRIKKEINQIKQGKKGTYISVNDMTEIFKNKKKFEQIKDFELLWNHLSDLNKKMANNILYNLRFW
jgi:hypothetical protein